jgi:hypothetical protein
MDIFAYLNHCGGSDVHDLVRRCDAEAFALKLRQSLPESVQRQLRIEAKGHLVTIASLRPAPKEALQPA